MALTRQQFDELRAKGLTVDQIIKFESGQVPVTTQAKPNFFQGVGQKLQARGKEFASEIGKAGKGELASTSLGTIARATTRAGSLIGGSLGDILVEGIKAVLPQKTEEKIKSGISNIASKPIPQKVIQSVSSWAEKNPEAAKDLEGTLELAGLIPLGKAAQIGGKAAIQTGKEVAGDISKVAGKTLATTGAVTEKAGKSLVSASFPPTKSQAKAILSYKSKTPLLKRVELAAKSAEKAPITPSEVALKYNLIGISRSEIGAKAKRVANQLFENQVNPVISGIEKKVNVKDLFNSVKKTIDKTADTSKRKSLINAFNSLKDDYKNVSTLSYKKLDQIKSEMSKGLPAKVWQGQDIAGELNNVRKMFSDKAREVIRKELPDNVKRVYDEYGSLLSIMEKGEKSLQRGLDVGVLGLTSEAIRRAGTPITTIGGKAINKAGEIIKGVGQRLQKGGTKLKSQGEKGSLLNVKPGLTIEDVSLKGKGEILKTTQKLDSLNPTGSVFAKYTPKQRAIAELADNITTLDKTMGKSADEMITIYRGSSKGGEIVPGDFITTNKKLAKDYAGTGKVLEKKVKLSDILDDLTEPLGEEYIYRPKTNLKSTPLVSKTEQSLIKEAKKIMEKEGRPHRFDLSDDEFLKKVFITKEEAAKNIVDAYKKKNSQMLTNRVRDAHSAPGIDDYTIKDVISGKSNQPKDILTLDGLKKYGNESFYGKETINAINQAQKTGKIKIYRAVPKNVNKIEGDDWVYLVKEQATTHGKNRLEGDYKILSKEVNIDDIRWDGNDIREWGYAPKSTPLKSLDDSLIQEAKKYKSADEFVNENSIKHISQEQVLPKKQGDVQFYHGTDVLNYDKLSIPKFEGLTMDRNHGDYFYITPNRGLTENYGRYSAGFNIPKEKILSLDKLRAEYKKLGDNNIDFDKFTDEQFKKYWAIEMPDNEYIVKDVSKIRDYTKSQLTDIWNKAQKLK